MAKLRAGFVGVPFLIVLLGFLSNVDATLVSVVTKYGEIVGQRIKVSIRIGNSVEEYFVQSFEGIPYAKPPIGNLRFKAPVEPEPWMIKKMALRPSKVCVQFLPINFSLPIPPSVFSEDCLYLNVWTPVPVPKKAAVMVWIYGGAFATGTTILYNYKKLVATQGVIVVSMNYRVSSLGFLYLGNEDCPGNMGLLDQNLALNWVRDNIERFGGDPEKVTIFGQSAGSTSTALHFLNPNSQHLFKRVIMESGPIADWSLDTRREALERSIKVSRALGCGDDLRNADQIVDCLRNVDPKVLVETSSAQGDSIGLNHRPVEDNIVVLRNRYDFIKSLKNKEVLLGTTSDDGAFIIEALLLIGKVRPEDVFDAFIRTYIGDLSDEVKKCIRYYHEPQCNASPKHSEEILTARCSTTYHFTCKMNEFADYLAEADIPTFKYQWIHRPKLSISLPWVKADHASEIIFLLGVQSPFFFLPGVEISEVKLSRRVMAYWANFAKYGDPNGESSGFNNSRGTVEASNVILAKDESVKMDPWPLYTLAKKKRLDIGLHSSLSKSGPLEGEQCHFWKNIYPVISNASGDPSTSEKFLSVCNKL